MSEERDIKTISFGRASRSKIGMYLSSDQQEALNLGLREIYVNSLDSFVESKTQNGKITIEISDTQHSVSVIDNGPGIPSKIMENGENSVIAAFTMPHTGSHTDGREVNAIGTNGIGASVVTHTSSYFRVISNDGKEQITVNFRGTDDGAKVEQFISTKPRDLITGVSVEYIPDIKVYGDAWFDEEALLNNLKEMMKFYPNVQLKLRYHYKDHSTETLISYPNGLKQKDTKIYYESPNLIISLETTPGEIKPFGNRLYLPQGGNFFSHFKSTMTRTINELSDMKLSGTQIQSVFNGYVAIFVNNPLFSNQSKTSLSNKEVNAEISMALKGVLEKFSKTAEWEKTIKALALEMKAEEAATKARERVMAIQKEVNKKLDIKADIFTDCNTKSRAEAELYLVEGLSAATTPKAGRDPKTQAVLAIRGKILNVARVAAFDKIIENKEIQTIIKAIGGTIRDSQISIQEKDLRFGKIIILADSDSDGIGHICPLLLTLFYKMMPSLITNGHIYVAEPYLYKVEYGVDQYQFLKDDTALKEFSKKQKKYNLLRFKGVRVSPAPNYLSY